MEELASLSVNEEENEEEMILKIKQEDIDQSEMEDVTTDSNFVLSSSI